MGLATAVEEVTEQGHTRHQVPLPMMRIPGDSSALISIGGWFGCLVPAAGGGDSDVAAESVVAPDCSSIRNKCVLVRMKSELPLTAGEASVVPGTLFLAKTL